jgi:hypothetical protein
MKSAYINTTTPLPTTAASVTSSGLLDRLEALERAVLKLGAEGACDAAATREGDALGTACRLACYSRRLRVRLAEEMVMWNAKMAQLAEDNARAELQITAIKTALGSVTAGSGMQ